MIEDICVFSLRGIVTAFKCVLRPTSLWWLVQQKIIGKDARFIIATHYEKGMFLAVVLNIVPTTGGVSVFDIEGSNEFSCWICWIVDLNWIVEMMTVGGATVPPTFSFAVCTTNFVPCSTNLCQIWSFSVFKTNISTAASQSYRIWWLLALFSGKLRQWFLLPGV